MFQRKDYLVRMNEEMSQLIGTVIAKLRKERKQQEALQNLEELLSGLHMPGARLLSSLPEDNMIQMISTGGSIEPDRLAAAGIILKERGDILEELGNGKEGLSSRMKSLYLLLKSHELGADPKVIDYPSAVQELVSRLRSFRLPSPTLLLLHKYYVDLGHYDLAENALYDLLEAGEKDTGQLGFHFYERLLGLPEELLESGGLPIEEVKDGLQTWKERHSTPPETSAPLSEEETPGT
ncbi:DUF6483 family protein [Paenibacillus larvae]